MSGDCFRGGQAACAMMVCSQGVYVLVPHVMPFLPGPRRASRAANGARDNSRRQRPDDSALSEFQIAARRVWRASQWLRTGMPYY